MPVIDLVSLIEQTTAFHKIGQANNHLNGVEYWGVCPYCGTGNDRFHVFPEATKPHFWCRICGKTGDHIDILRHFKSLSYVEACEELGVEPGDTILHAAPMFFDDQPPCKEWEDMARTLIERAQRFLWKDKARHALDYLRGRGLTDETIVNAQLGYIPLIDGKWFQSSFSDWGLTDEMLSEKQKAKGCVRVPNGILIPWIADGHIWKLAIKRFEASGDEPKYGQVIGSKDALYGSDSLTRGKPVLLLEGEFDVLSALQEAGDLIIPIGTGSANKLFDMPLWIARIATYASVVLIGFDKDENQAGNMASQQWLQLFANSERWLPYSHDVNDMLQEGKDIRAWIETGLNIATTPQKPPAREEEPFIDCCVGCKRDLNNYDEEASVHSVGGNHFLKCQYQSKQNLSSSVSFARLLNGPGPARIRTLSVSNAILQQVGRRNLNQPATYSPHLDIISHTLNSQYRHRYHYPLIPSLCYTLVENRGEKLVKSLPTFHSITKGDRTYAY